EVAHADVVKAQLQRQQRERDAQEAEVNIEKAKIALAVLLFADINQPFTVADDMKPDEALLSGDDARRLTATNNPFVRAAESTVNEANFGVDAARGKYFPVFAIDYFFGIDANKFARRNFAGQNYVGNVV